MWLQAIELPPLSGLNFVVNISGALGNVTFLIWLHASLCLVYGVGKKTALITGAFGIILGFPCSSISPIWACSLRRSG